MLITLQNPNKQTPPEISNPNGWCGKLCYKTKLNMHALLKLKEKTTIEQISNESLFIELWSITSRPKSYIHLPKVGERRTYSSERKGKSSPCPNKVKDNRPAPERRRNFYLACMHAILQSQLIIKLINQEWYSFIYVQWGVYIKMTHQEEWTWDKRQQAVAVLEVLFSIYRKKDRERSKRRDLKWVL